MSDWPWVAASYGLTWIVLGTYAALILRRGARAARDREAAFKHTDSPEKREA